MTLARRDFLRTMMAGAGWGVLGSCASLQSCRETIANRPVRRNLTSLAPDDPIILAYKSAVTQMKALPSTDRRSWARQAQIHNDFCPHNNWLFLPWHRAYLFYFERICRKLSGMDTFALPYWNWSQEAHLPAPFWGGSSNPLFNGTRVVTASSTAASANVGAMTVNSILDESNFLLFGSGAIPATGSQRAGSTTGRLEGTPHNYIHRFVGGDMGGYLSPLDPIFWLHHNNIERLWVQWQFDRDHDNTEDPAWLNREFTEFCDEDGAPVTTSVAWGLLYPVLSYRFDDVGPGSPASRNAGLTRKAAEEKDSQKAKSGAAIRADVLRRFAAPQPATVPLGQSSSLRLAVDAGALRGVGASGAPRALLSLRVPMGQRNDVSVRVFLNKPDATAQTSTDDPHFAGAIAFFEHTGPGHDHRGDLEFILDATDAVQRLGLEGGPLDLTVVLVPFPDRQPAARSLQLSATELRLSRDSIVRRP
ncbi:MAG: tyrosinase family protein [Kofleriaceae bacterium]